MCGIVGYAGRSDGLDEVTLQNCRDALHRRGPDSAGSWLSNDRCVALGHRRLAIVELSDAGAQPMHWRSPNLSIVFNGEIYNHNELRKELRAFGYDFQGNSDTEVILAGFARWQEGVFTRLRGMFALAIYDHANRTIVLARDRVGEKPLYWARHRGGVFFASEIKAIFADKSFPRSLDLEGLNSYLTFGYVPGDQCLVKGISKVPPAHYLTFNIDRLTVDVHAYWSLPQPSPQNKADESQLVDELQSLLTDSVREQLEADVPVSVLLSGGTDSSLVTACAAAVSPTPVRTFSVGFPGQREFDERKHARRIANYFGAQHTELDLDPSSVDLVPQLARHFDEPIADSSMIPTFLLSQLVMKHGKAVLGGDGGDELFGGYRAYQGALRLEAIRSLFPSILRNWIATSARTALPIGFPNRNALVNLGESMAEGVARIGTMFDSAMRRQIVPALRKGDTIDRAEVWKLAQIEVERGVPGAFMAADFRSYLPCDILVKVDRASMANSLEVRAPFLDSRIVEFAFKKIPNELRVTTKDRKILLKRLAARMLPADFDAGRKQGFSIPLAEWLSPKVRAAACDRFEAQFARVFDFGVIRPLIKSDHVGGVSRVFGLLILMHWMEAYDLTL